MSNGGKKTSPRPTDAELPSVEFNSLVHSKFRTAYGPKKKVLQEPGGESLTKQSFKDECDINVIMRRYQTTGVLPELGEDGQYLDCTGADYQDAMNIVASARSQFEQLPARAREFFKNDPANFVEYMEKPDLVELGELGLLSAEAVARLKAQASGSPGEPVEKKPPPPVPPTSAADAIGGPAGPRASNAP